MKAGVAREESGEVDCGPDSPSLSASAAFIRFVQQKCEVKKSSPEAVEEDDEDEDDLLDVVADSVPKIVPNVILAKRDELIPLMLATITVSLLLTFSLSLTVTEDFTLLGCSLIVS